MHYGALSWRFHEDDFRVRSHTIERYGASAIPQDSSVIDWPLSYADLEPFYDRAEYELGVSGKAGNLQGSKIDGGNVFEAPRRRDYPLPALTPDQSGVLFDAGAKKLGYHPFSSPRAILSHPYHDRPGCTYCGFCQSFGCHVGAKSSILVTKLPEADATGNFKLLTSVMCYRVNSDNSGRVTGVAYYGPDGSDNTIEADLVILAPFIYDNTRLLLLSKTEKFPNGLANSSGAAGQARHRAHYAARLRGVRRPLRKHLYGASAQKHSLDDFNADNFDHSGLGFIRGAQVSVAPADLEGGPIGTAMAMTPPPGMRRWGAEYRDFWRNISRATRPSWRKPKIFRMPTRRSISIPTCAINMVCPRRASRMTGDARTKWLARNFCWGSSKKSAAAWARSTCGAVRSATACPERIMKAAHAWVATRRIRW